MIGEREEAGSVCARRSETGQSRGTWRVLRRGACLETWTRAPYLHHSKTPYHLQPSYRWNFFV